MPTRTHNGDVELRYRTNARVPHSKHANICVMHTRWHLVVSTNKVSAQNIATVSAPFDAQHRFASSQTHTNNWRRLCVGMRQVRRMCMCMCCTVVQQIISRNRDYLFAMLFFIYLFLQRLVWCSARHRVVNMLVLAGQLYKCTQLAWFWLLAFPHDGWMLLALSETNGVCVCVYLPC